MNRAGTQDFFVGGLEIAAEEDILRTRLCRFQRLLDPKTPVRGTWARSELASGEQGRADSLFMRPTTGRPDRRLLREDRGRRRTAENRRSRRPSATRPGSRRQRAPNSR